MGGKRLGVVCGGSGSSKFVTALKESLSTYSRTPLFVANVADNFWHYGLYICPDIDILIYALAGRLDTKKGWGIKNDTASLRNFYAALDPSQAWFNLGDADAAISIWRTQMINKGWRLSRITKHILSVLRIREAVVPATDDDVQTFVKTNRGKMHLQEFWVKNQGRPVALDVEYKGHSNARPNSETLAALSDRVLILPADPVSSILPTIGLVGVTSRLEQARVVAISPFVGAKPFSGPAAKFMLAIGAEPSTFGVAKLYSRFLKVLLVDPSEDARIVQRVSDLGIECLKRNITIRNRGDRKQVANEIANLL
jgi:LPPG:FO 2-phospho-L-lactate transferase